MKSVNQEIAAILDKDMALQKCLKREVINTRALAQVLLKEHLLPYSLDAIISAIRRYDLEDISILNSKESKEAFSKMLISTKDNVTMIVIKDALFKVIAQDFLNEQKLKDNVRLLKGKETISLFVNQKDLEFKLKLFPSSHVVEMQKNLSEIRLHFSGDVRKIKGIIARVTSELAMLDINIEQIFYTFPDVLLYVKEENLVKAHQSLLTLKSSEFSTSL